jgi:hypothetical protein
MDEGCLSRANTTRNHDAESALHGVQQCVFKELHKGLKLASVSYTSLGVPLAWNKSMGSRLFKESGVGSNCKVWEVWGDFGYHEKGAWELFCVVLKLG